MKLNADIVYAELTRACPAGLTGYHTSELNLQRPEFYLDSWEPMLPGHFYILPKSQFPRHLKLEKGCTILCCDQISVPSQLLDRCCVIRLNRKTDPFTVMNMVTKIYDRYSYWYDQLHEIVETTADLSEMAELSSRTLRNPILILDSEFRLLTTAGYEQQDSWSISQDKNGGLKVSPSALNRYLGSTDLKLDVTDPIHMEVSGRDFLSYNLFDSKEYAGSLTMEYKNRPYNPGDEPLIRLFAHYLMLAMKKHSQFLSSGHGLLRKNFQNLIENMPLSLDDREHLERLELPKFWRCMVLQPTNQLSQVPVSYLCDHLELLLPKSVAFAYENAIVVFFGAESPENGNASRENFIQRISDQFETEHLKIGVSSLFSDLYDTSWHYTQAMVALENGMLFDPDQNFYFFENYALNELIINSTGDAPLEMYYSDGLKKLFEHDAASSTSYIETLRAYLNNNMNVTATAEQLYIHRSTLMERLSRIKNELWDDLSDPNVQLRLRIILKALEYRQNSRK